jgi:hypothetical protein
MKMNHWSGSMIAVNRVNRAGNLDDLNCHPVLGIMAGQNRSFSLFNENAGQNQRNGHNREEQNEKKTGSSRMEVRCEMGRHYLCFHSFCLSTAYTGMVAQSCIPNPCRAAAAPAARRQSPDK